MHSFYYLREDMLFTHHKSQKRVRRRKPINRTEPFLSIFLNTNTKNAGTYMSEVTTIFQNYISSLLIYGLVTHNRSLLVVEQGWHMD